MYDLFYLFQKRRYRYMQTNLFCTQRSYMYNPHYYERALSLRNTIDFGMYQGNTNQQDTFCSVRKTYLKQIFFYSTSKKLGILGSKCKQKVGSDKINAPHHSKL